MTQEIATPPSPDTLSLMARRRSVPIALMTGPGPTADQCRQLLALASRTPDHGKLVPWRFIVFAGEARERAGRIFEDVFSSREPLADSARLTLERERFLRAPLVVAVVSRAQEHTKIPVWEQQMSAGAVCMNISIAANAMGYRTAWLTEWIAYDPHVLERLGLNTQERIAGYLYIGSVFVAPEDRPRPDPDGLTIYF